MKIICPQHAGAIEVPDKDIKDAFLNPSHSIVCHCPVCEEDILIENIQLETTPDSQDRPMKQ
jgi:hypothetical protein